MAFRAKKVVRPGGASKAAIVLGSDSGSAGIQISDRQKLRRRALSANEWRSINGALVNFFMKLSQGCL